ncbi:MAG: hypothetical protein JSS11_15780 [Verrucomicrobia bacterium]|nr:hypothetical protein [Verrucomicrobiota bacterium]
MANRRINIIWGGAERQAGEWHLGLWGTHERSPGSRIRDLTISGRGVLRWAAALTVAGYLAAMTALFYWFDSRPNNLVTYPDTLLLPLRWKHIQELRGQAYIAEGLDDVKKGRWGDGQRKLQAGLARYPRDLRARLVMSQFYALIDRRPQALTMLREGLEYGYPGRAYLETLFRIAAEGEDFSITIATCDRFLPEQKADHDWLLAQKITALIGDKQPAEALRLAEDRGTGDAFINEAHVMALLDLKRAPEAEAFLADWLKAYPAQEGQIVRLQVRTYRELNQTDRMQQALERMRALDPVNSRPYVYAVVQLAMVGDTAGARAALERYFLRFGGSADDLVLLAEPLSEIGAGALLQRLTEEAAAHGFVLKPYKSAQALMLLQQGDIAGAKAMLEQMKSMVAKDKPTEVFWFDWMSQLTAAASATEDSPAVSLTALLQSRPLPLKTYRLSTQVLMRADRLQAARAVLAIGERSAPTSRTLALLRKDLEQAVADAQRKAAPTMVAVATTAQTDKAFFQKLDEDQKAGRWAEAAQSIREVRVAKPAWLAQRNAEVLQRQMRVAVELGDVLEVLSAERLYLDGSTEHSQQAVAIARLLGERGARSDAQLVLAEVMKRSPDFPPVRRLKEEWAAADAKAKAATKK